MKLHFKLWYAPAQGRTLAVRRVSGRQRDVLAALQRIAADHFGHREGRDYRIVADPSIFGMRAKGCGVLANEIITVH